ncbi:hypothetical protein BG61_07290 [Caballeronia glathei]|uniref:Uncharacterized protein n=1 Tax=Caballeronia glathei TaxID=60547 RepID=A0A069PS73_9BURK|nr:hypothetical protein BG61_07290 [Caballeronia glathei]
MQQGSRGRAPNVRPGFDGMAVAAARIHADAYQCTHARRFASLPTRGVPSNCLLRRFPVAAPA